MIIEGRIWKFGDDIDTDAIIPARYLNTSDPGELARHVMEDADKEFSSKVRAGDIIIAERISGAVLPGNMRLLPSRLPVFRQSLSRSFADILPQLL